MTAEKRFRPSYAIVSLLLAPVVAYAGFLAVAMITVFFQPCCGAPTSGERVEPVQIVVSAVAVITAAVVMVKLLRYGFKKHER